MYEDNFVPSPYSDDMSDDDRRRQVLRERVWAWLQLNVAQMASCVEVMESLKREADSKGEEWAWQQWAINELVAARYVLKITRARVELRSAERALESVMKR